MTSPLEMLRWERRRKLQVREAFRAALVHYGSHPEDPAAFYSACAAYLVPAQRRLIDQDMRLADLLKPRVPATATADHEGIESLRVRLRQSDDALRRFEMAAVQFAARGAADRKDFEQASQAYIDFVVNVLGAKSHSLRHLTTTLFSADDWSHIAGITEEVVAEEGRLFERVRALAPAGCDPEAVSTERSRPG